MSEFVKKSLLLGLGLVSVTREKFESTVEELIKRGELSENEGKDLVSELKSKTEEVRTETTKKVEKIVADTLARLDVARKAEIDELKERIALLEKAGKEE
jgi:polyhydroxyalkanoate synthesis regulator phasin